MEQWKLFKFGKEAWEAMLFDIDHATASIDLEQYIFVDDDEIGKRFVDVLMRKAQQGIKVQLICDMVGSVKLYLNGDRIQELENAGIQIRFFHPISPWRIHNFTSWFFRDHRKILIVDGKIGFTGGLGVNYEMKDWRDTVVRIEGSVIDQMGEAFEKMWEIAKLRKFIPSEKPNGEEFSFIINAPHRRQRFVHREYIEVIRGSRNYVYLTTPYLVPDHRLFRVMRLAAHRGVDVRLIIPKKSDVGMVDAAGRLYIAQALKAGIKVYQYREDVRIHTKTAAVDDRWSTVGSCNLDNRSFLWNYEANLISTEPQFAKDIKEQFMDDLLVSTEVNYKEWQQRPFLDRLKELLIWPIHSFL